MQEIHNCLFHLGRDPSEILSWPISFRKQLFERHVAQRKFDEQEAKKAVRR